MRIFFPKPLPMKLNSFTVSLLIGAVYMVYLYFVAFDQYSEDALVQLSFLWFPLIIYGLSGLYFTRVAQASEGPVPIKPVRRAVIWAIVGTALLVFFFGAIFPSL